MAVGGHTAGGGLTGEVGILYGQVCPADRALLPLCQSACDTGIAGGAVSVPLILGRTSARDQKLQYSMYNIRGACTIHIMYSTRAARVPRRPTRASATGRLNSSRDLEFQHMRT